MALLALGAAEEAAVIFDGVVEADPKARDSWAGLGVAMAELGQADAALRCQQAVLRLGEAEREAEGAGPAPGA